MSDIRTQAKEKASEVIQGWLTATQTKVSFAAISQLGDRFAAALEQAMSVGGYTTEPEVIHGKTCPKADHETTSLGYYHTAEYDGPFDMQGFFYCGRCHRKM